MTFLLPLLPEATLLAGALLFLGLTPFGKPGPVLLGLVGLLGPVCAALACVAAVISLGAEGTPFSGYVLSGFSQPVKATLALLLPTLLTACGRLPDIAPRFRALHQFLLFACVFGMTILSGVDDLVPFAVVLILTGLLPALLPLLRARTDAAAGGAKTSPLKAALGGYLLCEGAAALLTILGLSCLSALTGVTALSAIADARGDLPKWALVAFLAALALPLVRLTLWPLQRRLPELCRDAALESAGPLALLPGISGLIALLRLLPCLPPGHEPFIQLFFAVLALLAMLSGSLCALAEDGLRPFLAWLGVTRSGCIVLALVQPEPFGPESCGLALCVALCSAIALATCWTALAGMGRDLPDPRLADLRGLARRQPARAGILAAALLGLAGIPPLAGFMCAFLTLEALVRAGHPLVAVCAGATTVLALLPCLRLLRALREFGRGRAARAFTPLPPAAFAAGIALILILLLFGLLPARFLDVAAATARAL